MHTLPLSSRTRVIATSRADNLTATRSRATSKSALVRSASGVDDASVATSCHWGEPRARLSRAHTSSRQRCGTQMRCCSSVLHAARYEHSSVKLTELAGREVGAHAPCASFRIAFAAQHGPCQNAHAPEGTGAAAYGRIFGRLRRSAASRAASRPLVPWVGRRVSSHVHVAGHRAPTKLE